MTMNILIVDRSVLNSRTIAIMFEFFDCKVIEASNFA
jgi:hypothetical protein